MNDTLIKFQGGHCCATSCGSHNPVAAMLASAMLNEMNQFGSVAQTQDVPAPSVGNVAAIVQQSIVR